MRVIAQLILAASLSMFGSVPLPGLPAIPEGSQVRVLRDELQSVVGTGTVKSRTLTLWATNARLPAQENVLVWIAVPTVATAAEIKAIPGTVTSDGMDITLEVNREKASFAQVLRDVYGIRLEMRDKK